MTLNENVHFTKSYFNQLSMWLIWIYLRLTGHLRHQKYTFLGPGTECPTDQPTDVKDEKPQDWEWHQMQSEHSIIETDSQSHWGESVKSTDSQESEAQRQDYLAQEECLEQQGEAIWSRPPVGGQMSGFQKRNSTVYKTENRSGKEILVECGQLWLQENREWATWRLLSSTWMISIRGFSESK